MQLGYTIIYVPDVESAIIFYEKAFSLERGFLCDSKEYGDLNTGSTKLAFVSESMAQSIGIAFARNSLGKEAAGFEVALVTPDVQRAYKHAVDNGATAVKEPERKPWGQEISYVRDLNGVLVEICSPIGQC